MKISTFIIFIYSCLASLTFIFVLYLCVDSVVTYSYCGWGFSPFDHSEIKEQLKVLEELKAQLSENQISSPPIVTTPVPVD